MEDGMVLLTVLQKDIEIVTYIAKYGYKLNSTLHEEYWANNGVLKREAWLDSQIYDVQQVISLVYLTTIGHGLSSLRTLR